MAISGNKTKFKEITLEQQRAFSDRNKSGYELEFDDQGHWIAPAADAIANNSISIPSYLDLSEAQKAGLVLSVNQNLQDYHKRLTHQEIIDLAPEIHLSLEDAQIVLQLKTDTNPPLYSEFVIEIASLTTENGEPQQAEVKLQGTWDLHQETGYIDGNIEMDTAAFLDGPLYLSGHWDTDGYHYYDEKYENQHFWPSLQAKQEEANLDPSSKESSSNEFQRAWLGIVDAALELANNFILMQVMVLTMVEKISALHLPSTASSVEKPQEEKQASVKIEPLSAESVGEIKTAADSQNIFAMFSSSAVGKMVMEFFALEAINRGLGPIEPPTCSH